MEGLNCRLGMLPAAILGNLNPKWTRRKEGLDLPGTISKSDAQVTVSGINATSTKVVNDHTVQLSPYLPVGEGQWDVKPIYMLPA